MMKPPASVQRALCSLLSMVAILAMSATSDAAAQAVAPSDTIVRLAVDGSRFAGRPVVVLLEESVSSVEPDGRWTQTIRQVHQVLDANGARGASERQFGYAKNRQALTLNWVRVLRPSGEVVSDKPAQEQDTDAPAALRNPVYSDLGVKRISLAGVAPGTIVDLSWTLEEKAPHRAGDFLFQWNIGTPVPTANSRFVIDVPEAFEPRIVERNLSFKRSEETANGRKQYIWEVSNIPAYIPEPYAADSNGVTQSIRVSSPSSWSDITGWYNSLAKDRYTLDKDVALLADSIVKASGARTRADTIRAVHRWVAQDVRYVSVSLGIGGYQPRMPSEVLRTGFGDCKDKTTLFVAAMRRYGIPSNPVLLSLQGRADRRVPSIFQFNHAIASVGDGAARIYVDLTADLIPVGELPMAYQGSLGVVVNKDGSSEEIEFPVAPTDSNASTVRLTLVLDSTGNLSGNVVESAIGSPALQQRSRFRQAPDSTARVMAPRAWANGMFPGATGDSLVFFDGLDLSVPAIVTYRISVPNQLRTVGDTRVLTLSPFIRGRATQFAENARNLESRPSRRTPIDASRILAMAVTLTDVRIRLPSGWKAELPPNVLATSFFGSYESTWTQEGDELRLVRRIQGQRGIHPPQRIAEVITWYKTVSADSYEFLTLKAPSTQ